jgi:hypothetical protein
MEGEPNNNKIRPSMYKEAVHELHELEVSAGNNISDDDYEAFLSLIGRMKEREGQRKTAHLSFVDPRSLGKFDALMYRWARNVQSGTDEFDRFTKEKDSIESLLREAKGTSAIESRIAFYEFLTNLIEAPVEKRVPQYDTSQNKH